jgi:hypothetical protein
VERVGRNPVERRLLEAVAPPSRRRTTRLLGRFAAAWLVVVVMAIAVAQRTAAVSAADYRIDLLSSQVARLSAVDQALAARCASLASAARLARVAQRQGLVLPTTVAVLPDPALGVHPVRDPRPRAAAPSWLGRVTRAVWRLVHGG